MAQLRALLNLERYKLEPAVTFYLEYDCVTPVKLINRLLEYSQPRYGQIVDRMDDVTGLEVDELRLAVRGLGGDNQSIGTPQIGQQFPAPRVDLDAENPEPRHEVLLRGDHIRKRIPRPSPFLHR